MHILSLDAFKGQIRTFVAKRDMSRLRAFLVSFLLRFYSDKWDLTQTFTQIYEPKNDGWSLCFVGSFLSSLRRIIFVSTSQDPPRQHFTGSSPSAIQYALNLPHPTRITAFLQPNCLNVAATDELELATTINNVCNRRINYSTLLLCWIYENDSSWRPVDQGCLYQACLFDSKTCMLDVPQSHITSMYHKWFSLMANFLLICETIGLDSGRSVSHQFTW